MGSEYSLVVFVTHTDNLSADDAITIEAVVALGDGVLGICVILNTDGDFDKNGFHWGGLQGKRKPF
jgi:hypothetical protein